MHKKMFYWRKGYFMGFVEILYNRWNKCHKISPYSSRSLYHCSGTCFLKIVVVWTFTWQCFSADIRFTVSGTMAFNFWKQVNRTRFLPYILAHSRNSLFPWEHADFGSVFPSDSFICLWQCLITLPLFDSIGTHTHIHTHNHKHTHARTAVGGGQVSAGGIER